MYTFTLAQIYLDFQVCICLLSIQIHFMKNYEEKHVRYSSPSGT